MTEFPSTLLPSEVAQRLLLDWDATHDELLALISVHKKRKWTREEDMQTMYLVRHIAVISSTLHGHYESAALTDGERAWLRTQGVPFVR